MFRPVAPAMIFTNWWFSGVNKRLVRTPFLWQPLRPCVRPAASLSACSSGLAVDCCPFLLVPCAIVCDTLPVFIAEKSFAIVFYLPSFFVSSFCAGLLSFGCSQFHFRKTTHTKVMLLV
jgi:hypothetical protein